MLAEVLRWQRHGACQDTPELWAMPNTAGLAVHQCLRHCPVLDQCRAWAAGIEWDSIVVAGVRWGTRGNGGPPRPAVHQTEELCEACATRDGCLECGGPIVGRARNAKTCSPECAKARGRRIHRRYEKRVRLRRCVVCRTSLPASQSAKRPYCGRRQCAEIWRARQSRASTASSRNKLEMEVLAA